MNFKEWFFDDNQQEDPTEFVVPAGSTFFHGTLEPFKELNASSFIGFEDAEAEDPEKPFYGLWLADNPAIAQAYIPTSGITTFVSPEHLIQPVRDETLQALQRAIGINIDYGEVEWQPTGARAQSWNIPNIWQGMRERDRLAHVEEQLKQMGFKPRYGTHGMYAIKANDKGGFFKPEEKAQGKLFVVKTKESLNIYDLTHGRRKEGDLTDLDYHKVDAFREARKAGYDGVKINDFAQVDYGDDYGTENTGHESLLIFRESMNKLSWKAVPAQHVNWEQSREMGWGTKEYPNQ